MLGTDLTELRARIEGLASPGGDYYLVCARRGDRPVPTDGLRFENRATARAAIHATEQYRETLRRYDPELPQYDIVVSEASCSADSPSRSDDCVEFCHQVAAAVFESLAAGGHNDIETTVMDSYLDLARARSDPDELCLSLLERIARELTDALSPGAQAAVIADAADRLPDDAAADTAPIDAACADLESVGLLSTYCRSPWSVDADTGTRSVTLELCEYALTPREGRLPTLPLVVALYRHDRDHRPTDIRVGYTDDGWTVSLTVGTGAPAEGVASAPIRRKVA